MPHDPVDELLRRSALWIASPTSYKSGSIGGAVKLFSLHAFYTTMYPVPIATTTTSSFIRYVKETLVRISEYQKDIAKKLGLDGIVKQLENYHELMIAPEEIYLSMATAEPQVRNGGRQWVIVAYDNRIPKRLDDVDVAVIAVGRIRSEKLRNAWKDFEEQQYAETNLVVSTPKGVHNITVTIRPFETTMTFDDLVSLSQTIKEFNARLAIFVEEQPLKAEGLLRGVSVHRLAVLVRMSEFLGEEMIEEIPVKAVISLEELATVLFVTTRSLPSKDLKKVLSNPEALDAYRMALTEVGVV